MTEWLIAALLAASTLLSIWLGVLTGARLADRRWLLVLGIVEEKARELMAAGFASGSMERYTLGKHVIEAARLARASHEIRRRAFPMWLP